MGYEELLEKLNGNSKEDSLEAVRLLVKVADNIIKDPDNTKVRTLQKSNPTLSKKVFNINGGAMCLKLMGFKEHETCFVLPAEANLTNVFSGKDTLLMWKESVESSRGSTANEAKPSTSVEKKSITQPEQEIIKPIILPPFSPLYREPFLHKIEVQFHNCLRYANKEVQERAKKLIPLVHLESAAQKRLRALHEHAKKNKLNEPNITIQDMLILELLKWFREDFFSWVNSPDCNSCQGKTRFSHKANDKALLIYTNNVELHLCESCKTLTPFPRYEDLNILLETRKGRCGEWANVFTLFCRAMGWDARMVLDENDHVWTEVYSIAQKRWLHCDPCEDICDKPLIYESGWKKNMTYVIAYSEEEVQDVTWRYSSQHKEVLKRRKLCDEAQLIKILMELRKKRQMSFSQARRDYLAKRLLLELADMLTERKPGDEEGKGRQSGDAIWRLIRGEIQDEAAKEFVWKIDPTYRMASVRYSAAKDTYELLAEGNMKNACKKWLAGCFKYNNIIRKEEKDWKQVYLARKDGENEGRISWKFEFQGQSHKLLDEVTVQFHHATFENGSVLVKLCSGDMCELIPKGTNKLQTNSFAGKSSVTVEAIITGGKGDVAWQHAQLFRQPLDSDDYPFSIKFSFKDL